MTSTPDEEFFWDRHTCEHTPQPTTPEPEPPPDDE